MQANEQRNYSSVRAATVLGMQAKSLSVALYRNGHYCGVRPARLPNGRLLWPADEIDALASGVRGDEAPDAGARLAAGRNRASAGEASK